MKKIMILFVIAMFGAVACGKEKELTPSFDFVNWYAIEDSSDPIDHLRYQIYVEYGVPVFYNDTIGFEERGYDYYGNPIVYYEILDPNYTINAYVKTYTIELSYDRDAIMAALELIHTKVLPGIKPTLRPRCYLVVDKIIADPTMTGSYNYQTSSVATLMAYLIGDIGTLKEMTNNELYLFAGKILAQSYAAKIANAPTAELSIYYDLLEKFYDYAKVKSRDGKKTINLYNFELKSSEGIYETANQPVYKTYLEYGFLDYHRGRTYDQDSDTKIWSGPLMHEDLAAFIGAVLSWDEEEFKAEYAAYAIILDKYDLIKQVVQIIDSISE